MGKSRFFYQAAGTGLFLAVMLLSAAGQGLTQGMDNPNPPEKTVKLIFVHHSSGENWLRDDYGGLGQALAQNNYFVSDTNYGWGPEGIGDRTDIVNWTEWFRGPQSPVYMQALFSESGQNSEYTRQPADPGGENQVVLFKSCFPNSNLEGAPGDPPTPGQDLTVGNAKYIYNDLLNYFRTRPDKLFIVITAPPVQDATYAANARAFNLWLVQDWLKENDYPYPNVAVFDFYNVLTGPDNHHRYRDGQVEHVAGRGSNTSSYPTGPDDDHPSAAGSRKATQEFIPLLNIFYHRWQAGVPAAQAGPSGATATALPPAPSDTAPAPSSTQPGGSPPQAATGLVDDFEASPLAGSEGWQAYWDEATSSKLTCGPAKGETYSGSQALDITYSVQPESWGTCALLYASRQRWDSAQGLSFYVRAYQEGLPFDVIVYSGTPEQRETYLYSGLVTDQEMVAGWKQVEIPWSELRGADWEAHAGAPLDPAAVTGLAFGFGQSSTDSGRILVDDIQLVAGTPAEPAPALTQSPAEPTQPPAEPTQPTVQAPAETVASPAQPTQGSVPDQPGGRGGIRPCASPLALGTAALTGWYWARRRRM